MKITNGDKITIRNKTNRKIAIQPFNQSFTWVIEANDVLEFPTENAHKALYYLKMGVNRESELDVTIGMNGSNLPQMKMGQYLQQFIIDPTADESTPQNMREWLDIYFNGIWNETDNTLIGGFENDLITLGLLQDTSNIVVAVSLSINSIVQYIFLKEEGKEVELSGGAKISESGWYKEIDSGNIGKITQKTTFTFTLKDDMYPYITTYNHRFDYLNGTVLGVVEVDGLIPFTSGMRVSGFVLDTTAATNEEIETAFSGTQTGSYDMGIPVIKYVSMAGREQPLLGYNNVTEGTPNQSLLSDLGNLYVPSDSTVGVDIIGYIWVKNDTTLDGVQLKTGWNKLDLINTSVENNFENNDERVYFYTLTEDASGKKIPYKTSTIGLGLSTTTKPTNLINLLNGKTIGAILPTEDLPQEGLCPFTVGEAIDISGCMVNTKAYTDAELLAIFDSVTTTTQLVDFVGDFNYEIEKASELYDSLLTDDTAKNQMILIFQQDEGVYSNGFALQYISSRLYEALKLPKAGWYLVQREDALKHTDRWILVDGYQELHFPIESEGEMQEPEELVEVRVWSATLQDNTIAKELNGKLFGAIRVVI